MASLPHSPLAMSLIDRLVDEAPDLSFDAPRSRAEELRAVRESFRRQIEAILNTRRRCLSPPAALRALKGAIPNFGVTDFTGMPLATRERRQELARSLEQTIRTFEPRFRSVNLSLVQTRDPLDRVLRIRIEAIARIEQSSEPMVFETALDPATRTFSVTERDDV
jgi:type VI secretion system protein ImpF